MLEPLPTPEPSPKLYSGCEYSEDADREKARAEPLKVALGHKEVEGGNEDRPVPLSLSGDAVAESMHITATRHSVDTTNEILLPRESHSAAVGDTTGA